MNHHHSLWVAAAVVATLSLFNTGCTFAPKQNDGDTVAAKFFEPVDTTSAAYKARAARTKNAADSTGVWMIGEASNRKQLQLISYPSHRDTLLVKRARNMAVFGNADFGHTVRVTFDKDSTVTQVMEVKK